MKFESESSVIFSDTPIPDIFLTEYLPSLKGDYVKIYLYCLFLSKYKKSFAVEDLSKKLCMDMKELKEGLLQLECAGVIRRQKDSVTLCDLKQKEINRIYRMKSTSTPEEVAISCERNKQRIKIISAINNSFFQGVMSPSWYTDIDAWFDKYNFDEDVMYALFQHCYDHKALSRNYIVKVAENWHSKKIVNSFDLDRYFVEYQRYRDIRGSVIKKLNLARNLTQYEEDYLEKWVIDYGFGLDIIEKALVKTTGKTNPSFRYIDAILSQWSEKGLKTVEEIDRYEEERKRNLKQSGGKDKDIPQHENFEQRKYDDDYFDNFFTNVK